MLPIWRRRHSTRCILKKPRRRGRKRPPKIAFYHKYSISMQPNVVKSSVPAVPKEPLLVGSRNLNLCLFFQPSMHSDDAERKAIYFEGSKSWYNN